MAPMPLTCKRLGRWVSTSARNPLIVESPRKIQRNHWVRYLRSRFFVRLMGDHGPQRDEKVFEKSSLGAASSALYSDMSHRMRPLFYDGGSLTKQRDISSFRITPFEGYFNLELLMNLS